MKGNRTVPDAADRLIRLALKEDTGTGDITARLLVPAGTRARGVIRAREPGVVAGMPLARQVFRAVDRSVRFRPLVKDGMRLRGGRALAEVSGPARSLLAAERTALNFLQHLSGIATLTRRYSDELKGSGVKILDTRKTTPGWRALEKAAVAAGGGRNHRMGLYDGILVKRNYLRAAGISSRSGRAEQLARLLKNARGCPRMLIEVEARSIEEVRTAIEAGVPVIMLDNMNLREIRKAVAMARSSGRRRPRLEVSGRVDLKRLKAIASTGVDYISAGALTHSAPALDIHMELKK